MSSGFDGSDFSHEGVKQVVGLLVGFVSAIASPPCGFWYLNHRIHDIKIKKIKKIKKNPPGEARADYQEGGSTKRKSIPTYPALPCSSNQYWDQIPSTRLQGICAYSIRTSRNPLPSSF